MEDCIRKLVRLNARCVNANREIVKFAKHNLFIRRIQARSATVELRGRPPKNKRKFSKLVTENEVIVEIDIGEAKLNLGLKDCWKDIRFNIFRTHFPDEYYQDLENEITNRLIKLEDNIRDACVALWEDALEKTYDKLVVTYKHLKEQASWYKLVDDRLSKYVTAQETESETESETGSESDYGSLYSDTNNNKRSRSDNDYDDDDVICLGNNNDPMSFVFANKNKISFNCDLLVDTKIKKEKLDAIINLIEQTIA